MRGLKITHTEKKVPRVIETARDLIAGETFRFVYSYGGTIYIKGPQNFYTQLTGPSAGAVWDGDLNRADAPVQRLRLETKVVIENHIPGAYELTYGL